MKLKSNHTGSVSFSDLQCQKAVSHLLIVKTGAAAFTTETINVALQDGTGNQRKLVTLLKVRDVALISQFTNGYLSQTVLAGGLIKSCYLLELNPDAAIDLKDETYLSIDMNNLVAASSYDVYGLESPLTERAFLNYNSTVISGTETQQKQYSVGANAFELGIRNNDSLAKLRLFYNNGAEVSYLPEELAAITREINDITQAADTLIEGDTLNQIILNGAAEMFYFPMVGVKSFEITTVGAIDCVFFLVNKEAF